MRAACLIAVVIAAAPLSAQPNTNLFDTVSQPPVDSETQADDVRFKKDDSNRMTVPVTLSGNGPFRFLVDTGADRTAISSAVASRLGLEIGPNASLHSLTGVSSVRTATVPNLRLSSKSLRVVDAPLLDAENMGADGILGTDSLRAERVVFDFEKKVMTIVPSIQKVVPSEEGTVVVYGRLRNGRLIVTNALADNNLITVVLDTGSEVSVGNSALRLRMGNARLLKSSGSVELESVTGETLPGEYGFLKRLDLGQVQLGNLAVVFADAHTFKQMGLDKRPALLLGMNALRAFRKVSIDFANRKLRIMLPDQGSLEAVRLASK